MNDTPYKTPKIVTEPRRSNASLTNNVLSVPMVGGRKGRMLTTSTPNAYNISQIYFDGE